MNLTDAQRMARTLMNENGLGHVPFEFDRSRRRLGCTFYTSVVVNGRKKKASITKISLSSVFVQNNDEAQVRNTILHEIAHGLDPEVGHGPSWARHARALGIKPERCNATAAMPKDHAWEAKCPNCGALAGKQHRAPLRVYMCGAAGCRPLPNKERALVWRKHGRVAAVHELPARYQAEWARHFA